MLRDLANGRIDLPAAMSWSMSEVPEAYGVRENVLGGVPDNWEHDSRTR